MKLYLAASAFPLEAVVCITLLLSLHAHTAMSVFPVAAGNSYMTTLDIP
jgi:hypothetical protein